MTLSLDVQVEPHAARSVELARTEGDDALAESIRKLGDAIAAYAKLSFDDEETLRAVVSRLRTPPFLGEVAAAITGSIFLEKLDDTDAAGSHLLGFFRARRASSRADFMTSADLLTQMARCAIALDANQEVLGWALEALSPPERARWAVLLAAGCDNVGLETTGGWLALASSCVADDAELLRLTVEAYQAHGMDAARATEMLAELGRSSVEGQ